MKLPSITTLQAVTWNFWQLFRRPSNLGVHRVWRSLISFAAKKSDNKKSIDIWFERYRLSMPSFWKCRPLFLRFSQKSVSFFCPLELELNTVDILSDDYKRCGIFLWNCGNCEKIQKNAKLIYIATGGHKSILQIGDLLY